jgi:hypothetical protein
MDDKANRMQALRSALAALRADRSRFAEQALAHCRAARTMLAWDHPAAGVRQLLLADEQRRRASLTLAAIRECDEEMTRLKESSRASGRGGR